MKTVTSEILAMLQARNNSEALEHASTFLFFLAFQNLGG